MQENDKGSLSYRLAKHNRFVRTLGDYPELQAYVGNKLETGERSIDEFIKNFRRYKMNGNGHSEESAHVRVQCEALNYALTVMGGSRKRMAIAYAVHDLFRGGMTPNPHIDDAVLIPELIHLGSVIDDDQSDKTEVRKDDSRDEIATFHAKYGAIAGPLAKGLYTVSRFFFDHPEIFLRNYAPKGQGKIGKKRMERINEAVGKTLNEGYWEGQMHDIIWSERDVLAGKERVPTKEEYIAAALAKSSFPLAARVGAIMGGAEFRQEESVSDLAGFAGIAFQLTDDLKDLRGEDIRGHKGGNKATYPVLLAFENPVARRELTEIFSTEEPKIFIERWFRESDKTRVNRAVEIINSTGAIEETRKTINEYIAKAKARLDREFPNENTALPRKILKQAFERFSK